MCAFTRKSSVFAFQFFFMTQCLPDWYQSPDSYWLWDDYQNGSPTKNVSLWTPLLSWMEAKPPWSSISTDPQNDTFCAFTLMDIFRWPCHLEVIARTLWYSLQKIKPGWKINGKPENKKFRKDRKRTVNVPRSITAVGLNRWALFQLMEKLMSLLLINVYPLICGGWTWNNG